MSTNPVPIGSRLNMGTLRNLCVNRDVTKAGSGPPGRRLIKRTTLVHLRGGKPFYISALVQSWGNL